MILSKRAAQLGEGFAKRGSGVCGCVRGATLLEMTKDIGLRLTGRRHRPLAK